MPGGMFVITYKPSLVAVASRSRPVSTDLAWTIAPGTTAPFGSEILPLIRPASFWPKDTPDKKATTNRAVRSGLLCSLKNCVRPDIFNPPYLYLPTNFQFADKG